MAPLHMLQLLRRVWQAHAAGSAVVPPGGGIGGAHIQQAATQDGTGHAQAEGREGGAEGHCATDCGVQLLREVAEAAEQLAHCACGASAASGLSGLQQQTDFSQQQQQQQQTSSLPFIMLRRASLLVLHLAHLRARRTRGRASPVPRP